MARALRFRRLLDFSELARDCHVSRVSVDWNGKPLVLVQEGKGPYPTGVDSTDQRVAWLKTAPKGHHLIHWEGAARQVLGFEHATGIHTSHVQRFEDGWLLGEGHGGRAVAYNEDGRHRRVLDLGDATEDIQTTSDGKIWISYFDEGVYGLGIGSQEGLLCFDASGKPIFRYSHFAKRNDLPFIDDCYAINACAENEIWVSYYSGFPLVAIRDFQLHKARKEFGCVGHAFGILGDTILFLKCYIKETQLLRRAVSGSEPDEPVEAVEETGGAIGAPFKTAARGSSFYLWNSTALYELIGE